MSSLNPTRYWVNYTDDERQLIIGYYNDDAYKEENVPTPNMEITEGVWQQALDNDANQVDGLDNLVVGDADISVYSTMTGEILRTLYFQEDPETGANEAVWNSGSDPATQYIFEGALTDRPDNTITINKNFVTPNETATLTGLTIGTNMKCFAKDDNMINVYLDNDDYQNEVAFYETDFTEDNATLTWPYIGKIEIQITGDFPKKDYTTTVEVKV